MGEARAAARRTPSRHRTNNGERGQGDRCCISVWRHRKRGPKSELSIFLGAPSNILSYFLFRNFLPRRIYCTYRPACLRRCPSLNRQTETRIQRGLQARAMWVRRALQRAEPGAPLGSKRANRGQAVRCRSILGLLR